ncbi:MULTISPECIES: type II toxin-antitoxin system VapC family toxin [Rhodopseudomonas]|uniref:Ribonuclease VapC n=1 Tax=Rhodopseudomonas palustris TaxID=1076 RepID=A0A0D7EK55_RHOPL|nr:MULTISPECIES: type II toxin-antitoxin system VapC family toxin [Rhodopseudomonas]KIZ41031.1 twitching motility protein PilT [Rhodopseudomonas palustris]MDF3809475.1 type II toxin-antitoxin system VapC family toxin [Rhodopseudomonas sp. BAL398]WOK18432.1 type II toxin-antitoxin system VapC family toxin [Rhodopseudomonas sp. BAL398]
MSDFVVDASVAVKWFTAEVDSLVADDLSASGHRLFAPRLIMTEVANALGRKVLAGPMSMAEALDNLRSLPNYFDEMLPVDDLVAPALENSCALRHPIYDLIYLETARRLDAQLVTADRRFATKLAGSELAHHVTLLSDWHPE